MRKIIIFLLSIQLFFLSGCEDNPVESVYGAVQGKVLDYITMQPVAGALISTEPPTSNAITDDKGEFVIRDLLPETYTIIAMKKLYYPGSTNVTIRINKTAVAYIILPDSSTNNHPPDKPELLSPPDESSALNTKIILKWSCFDEDKEQIKYDVYLDTSIFVRTIFISDLVDTAISVNNLVVGKTYYWKVKAIDRWGAFSESNIYTFTVDSISFPKIDSSAICYFPFEYNTENKIINNLFVTPANITFINGIDSKTNSAAYFNGTSHITVQNNPILQSWTELTISLWLKPDAGYGNPYPSTGYIFILGRWMATGPNTSSWGLIFHVPSKIMYGCTYDGTTNSKCSTDKLNEDVWTHVAFTYKAGISKIYINGDSVNSASAVAPQNSVYNLEIGWHKDNICQYKGGMDELIIFKRALTSSEIKQLSY